ncbi:MAG: sterol desaturase family protein [Phycisphaerales bacterium JB041]
MLYEAQSTIAAATLAACWASEAVVPFVRSSRVGAARCRHLLLGVLNALPGIGIAAALACADARADSLGLGLLGRARLPGWAAVLAGFLILDLCQYAGHVLMHKVGPLWRLHAVHHHAEHLEATTAFRFHTLEIVAQGIVLLPLVVVLGVSVRDIAVYNAVLLPMSLFHHANVRLPRGVERALGVVVITPSLHRVHHSRWQPQTDSNYSAVLSVWDRLFGTLTRCDRPEAIPIGLDGFGPEHTGTVGGMLRTPFSAARAEPGVPPRGACDCVCVCNPGWCARVCALRKEGTPMNTDSQLNRLYVPLRLCYGLVPIVAGADKFTNLLTDWSQYLPEMVAGALPFDSGVFMMIVGVIEIVAGLAVLTKLTRLGGYVVAAWLMLIAVNVALAGYLDIAVRDVVMALGAYTLAGLAAARGERLLPTPGPKPTRASSLVS